MTHVEAASLVTNCFRAFHKLTCSLTTTACENRSSSSYLCKERSPVGRTQILTVYADFVVRTVDVLRQRVKLSLQTDIQHNTDELPVRTI